MFNIKRIARLLLGYIYPEFLAKKIFVFRMNRPMRNPPVDLNEKINWLKFHSDTSIWVDLSDKYKVRKYISQKGLDDILIPLYGRWDHVEDIEWDKLPNSFVMKVNNGSGDVLICKDKSTLNVERQKVIFKGLLKKKYGITLAEPHYRKIKPMIIAEQLLPVEKQGFPSDSLVDYKVWCFHGKPYCVWTCYNRTPNSVKVATFDTKWNYRPEASRYNSHYQKADLIPPKPQLLDDMLRTASILADEFPEVRVDFYIVDNKLYFGEMTFTSAGGYMDFYTQSFLDEMGQQISL